MSIREDVAFYALGLAIGLSAGGVVIGGPLRESVLAWVIAVVSYWFGRRRALRTYDDDQGAAGPLTGRTPIAPPMRDEGGGNQPKADTREGEAPA